MKKIPTIFKRDSENPARVLPEPHPDCGWVFAGEGVATRKYDGTCCLVRGGKLYKRREVKPGTGRPPGFIEADHDDMTGKTVGWVPVDTRSPEDCYHYEAYGSFHINHGHCPEDGTYELIGPKIQGNPEGFPHHALVRHADAQRLNAPRTFEELAKWLDGTDIEGVVWHHEDGRMAKIKLKDFGLKRDS